MSGQNHTPHVDGSAVTPKADFREANPAPFGRTEGNLDSIRRLGVIETRAADLKARLRDHFARHEETWVAREAVRLQGGRGAPKLLHPAPRGAPPDDPTHQILQQARRNVRARATRRLTAVNATKIRMENAVIRTAPRQEVAPALALKPAFRKALRSPNP